QMREWELVSREALTQVSRMMGIENPADLAQGNWDNGRTLSVPRHVRELLHPAILNLEDRNSPLDELRKRLLALDLEAAVAAAHQQLNPSTTDAVTACMRRLNTPNMYHF